jgi:tetratricopeptide (TPR) repeat protein
MNETKCYKTSRKHTIITVLGITALAFLMLVSIAGATQSTNFWFHKGRELMSSEKYNEAIKAYDKAIKINPHDSSSWYNKGNSLFNLNKYDDAIEAYNKAIEINPQNLYAWENKGFALSYLNKPYEAREAYNRAIEINPQIRSWEQ